MAVGKEIKEKIGGVKNTQKITSAMEKVAVSKMRRAQQRMELSRPYANSARRLIGHLASANGISNHDYMQEREIKRVGYIVVSSDRGLAGGLNINMFKALLKDVKEFHAQNVEIDYCAVGSKGVQFINSMGGNIIGAETGIGDAPEVENLIGVIQSMLENFQKGKIDRLFLVFNKFENTMTQKPKIRQLLPLAKFDADDLGEHWDYIYEPSVESILDGLLMRYIESQVYQAVVENTACEQAARMLAMKNATDNAGELIDELNLLYNKARQAAITQEISEIVGGAAAV